MPHADKQQQLPCMHWALLPSMHTIHTNLVGGGRLRHSSPLVVRVSSSSRGHTLQVTWHPSTVNHHHQC